MLRPRRKQLVFGLAGFMAAITVVFAFHPVRDAICFPFLSPRERQVVGDWQVYMIGGVNVTTIHADHSWSSVGGSCLEGDFPPIVGRWRVDGSDIIFSLDPHQYGDLPTPEPKRVPIQQLIDDDRRTRASMSRIEKE